MLRARLVLLAAPLALGAPTPGPRPPHESSSSEAMKPVLQMLPQIVNQYFPTAQVQIAKCTTRMKTLYAVIMQKLECKEDGMPPHMMILAAHEAEREAVRRHAATRARHMAQLRLGAHSLLADVSGLEHDF